MKQKGIFYLAVCAILWSTGGLFIKLIDWHPIAISGLRSLLAGLVLWSVMIYQKMPVPILNRNTISAGLSLATSVSLFVAANKLTTAANAIVLQSANPVFVLLFGAMFWKRKISRRELWVVGLVAVGISLFFLDDLSPGNLVGNLLGLASAVFLGTCFLLSTAAKNLHETMSGVLLAHGFTMLIAVPVLIQQPPQFTPIATGSLLFLGIVQLGIPYVFYSYGARYCSPLEISLLGMLEPLMNPIWVAIFVHEIPGPFSLLGGGIVLATLVVWCVGNSRRAVS